MSNPTVSSVQTLQIERLFALLAVFEGREHIVSVFAPSLEEAMVHATGMLKDTEIHMGMSVAVLLATDAKIAGREGFLVSHSEHEEFIEAASESAAVEAYKEQFHQEPDVVCSSKVVSALLDKVQEDLAKGQVIVVSDN